MLRTVITVWLAFVCSSAFCQTYRPFTEPEFAAFRDVWLVNVATSEKARATAYGAATVTLTTQQTYQQLVDGWTFENGAPCGVEEAAPPPPPPPPPPPTASVGVYAYINSLVNHDWGPAANNDTDSQNWLERMNGPDYIGGAEFQYGYTSNPPNNNNGPEDWELVLTGWSGTDVITDVILGHDNFDFTQRPPNQVSPILAGESYVQLGTDTIAAWQTNAGAVQRYWVFTGLREPAPWWEPSTATPQQIADWMANSRGTYATYAAQYVAELQAAHPSLSIAHMDTSQPWMDLVENGPAAIQAIPYSEWFEDDAPHGRSDFYLVQAMIMHIYLYGEQPAAYTPPGGTGIDSAITTNWSAITQHLWDYINN